MGGERTFRVIKSIAAKTMKKLILLTIAMLVSVASFAQGTVIFNNRTQAGDAPVSRLDGTGVGAGFTAQLYLQSAPGVFTPLTPTTTFRTSSAAAAYFVNEINPFVVQGVLPGQSATFKMVVWDTSAGSYEAAAAQGFASAESAPFTIAQLGGTPAGGAPIPTPSLIGLQGFMIPEPSIVALGVLGSAALLFRRRKRGE
jgi:hypothetical protein